MPSVLVIGGGPAGASFAARMAEFGAEVTLVERLAFPRPRLGESLTPGVRDLLKATGAWPMVEREAFPTARDVHVLWEDDTVVRMKPGAEGLLVDRGRFDQLLLSHAIRQGVRVLQPATLVSQTASDHGWDVLVAHGGGQELIRTDLIADARGRSGQAGARRRAMGARTLAVYAEWQSANLPQHATVAAGARGWFWGIPLPGGRYTAQAFVSPATLHDMGEDGLEDRYRRLIESSPLLNGLQGAKAMGKVCATDATPFLVEEPVTPRSIRLGDAALALDPISSSGVQRAVQTALSGAIVANTLLRRRDLVGAAQDFYRNSLSAAAARHAAWAGTHYAAAARSRPDPFWSARAGSAPPAAGPEASLGLDHEVRLSPAARLVDVPCLGRAFVEMRSSLVHPALDEPVAFLAHQPLAPLISGITQGSIAALARNWSRHMPAATAVSIALWLSRKGVLVSAA
ncbi:flavin-dependent monooxygenase QhpG [Aestuariivirga sp.]|uniref:flavin-dependent monooxygenase QhpG n=1 Tax=Aestuariivirga sp. TaxID=2650926 RepID=UPI003BAAB974